MGDLIARHLFETCSKLSRSPHVQLEVMGEVKKRFQDENAWRLSLPSRPSAAPRAPSDSSTIYIFKLWSLLSLQQTSRLQPDPLPSVRSSLSSPSCLERAQTSSRTSQGRCSYYARPPALELISSSPCFSIELEGSTSLRLASSRHHQSLLTFYTPDDNVFCNRAPLRAGASNRARFEVSQLSSVSL